PPVRWVANSFSMSPHPPAAGLCCASSVLCRQPGWPQRNAGSYWSASLRERSEVIPHGDSSSFFFRSTAIRKENRLPPVRITNSTRDRAIHLLLQLLVLSESTADTGVGIAVELPTSPIGLVMSLSVSRGPDGSVGFLIGTGSFAGGGASFSITPLFSSTGVKGSFAVKSFTRLARLRKSRARQGSR